MPVTETCFKIPHFWLPSPMWSNRIPVLMWVGPQVPSGDSESGQCDQDHAARSGSRRVADHQRRCWTNGSGYFETLCARVTENTLGTCGGTLFRDYILEFGARRDVEQNRSSERRADVTRYHWMQVGKKYKSRVHFEKWVHEIKLLILMINFFFLIFFSWLD